MYTCFEFLPPVMINRLSKVGRFDVLYIDYKNGTGKCAQRNALFLYARLQDVLMVYR